MQSGEGKGTRSIESALAKKPFSCREASILSPLRYLGAKRRLAGYVAEVLPLNLLCPKVFVEPFAGGASVSLQLLNDDLDLLWELITRGRREGR